MTVRKMWLVRKRSLCGLSQEQLGTHRKTYDILQLLQIQASGGHCFPVTTCRPIYDRLSATVVDCVAQTVQPESSNQSQSLSYRCVTYMPQQTVTMLCSYCTSGALALVRLAIEPNAQPAWFHPNTAMSRHFSTH